MLVDGPLRFAVGGAPREISNHPFIPCSVFWPPLSAPHCSFELRQRLSRQRRRGLLNMFRCTLGTLQFDVCPVPSSPYNIHWGHLLHIASACVVLPVICYRRCFLCFPLWAFARLELMDTLTFVLGPLYTRWRKFEHVFDRNVLT